MKGENIDVEDKLSDTVPAGLVDLPDPDAGLTMEERAKAV